MPENCEVHREQLVEVALENKAPDVDSGLANHLAACPRCRSFQAALDGLQPAFALPDLYTQGLRYRTLKRLAAEAEPTHGGFLSLLIPLGLLSLTFWLALPLLLLIRLFDYWLSQFWYSLVLSALVLTSVGFLVGCLAFVTVTGSKYADQFKGRREDLSEGFHA